MEFISKTPKISITDNCTVPELVLRKCAEHANNGKSEYLIDGITDKRRYFRDMGAESESFASHLYKQGFRKGDFAIYSMSYQFHQMIIMMGVWRANGISRALYIEEDAETVLEKIKETNARWVFCQASNAEFYAEIEKRLSWKLTIVVCDEPVAPGTISIDEYYSDSGDQCPPLEITPNDIALVLPSSGTTGPSKGVAHSHKNMVTWMRIWSHFPFSVDHTNLLASKGTHISGSILPFCVALKGGTGVVLSTVDKYIVIKTVDKYKPKVAFAFPSFLLALASPDADGYDVNSIETILTGGSQITNEMKQGFCRIPNVSNVINAYGLTENPMVATSYDFGNKKTAYEGYPEGSVGKPYPGGEVKIIDLKSLKTLPPNKEGEVCFRSDYSLVGYYNDPQLRAGKMHDKVASPMSRGSKTRETLLDGEWFRSGDVGYLDENGFLFIVDRAKDIFKYYNDHISPTDIEIVISQHPLVKEVCVVPVKDEGGHVPRAFISLLDPSEDLQKTREEILKYANGKLPNYKRLRGGLYIITDFPKGKTGKVPRNLVATLEPPEDQL